MIDLELRTCGTCKHWRRDWPQTNKAGYLEAMCDEPADARDKKLMRGSDSCGHWARKG